MEYKLNKSEFYRIMYLLAGLFMFLFLFGILSLSSFAKTTSFNLKTASPRPTSSDGSCVVSFGTPSFTVNIPQDSAVASSYSKTFYYSTNLYVTTTSGTFLLRSDNYNFTATVYPNQGNTFTSDLHMSGIGSFELAGQFISADLVLDSDDIIDYYTFNGTEYGTTTSGSYGSTYRGDLYGSMRSEIKGFGISAVNSNFVTVSHGSGFSSSFNHFPYSDYSTYSPVNVANNVPFDSAFTTNTLGVGSPMLVDFPDYVGTSFAFCPSDVNFMAINDTSLIFSLSYFTDPVNDPVTSLSLTIKDMYNNPLASKIKTDSNSRFLGVVGSYYQWITFFEVNLDRPSAFNMLRFSLSGTSAGTIHGLSFGLFQRKLTLNDYMDYVKDNWNNISPNVTTTNQNIAQSQTDIGTAQTFETDAFTDFDSAMTSSGLDNFSLSFNSTPLFWCASIINTFYNNMPVGFQYLLSFVAFIGILCTVLNIFGRVAQRFGDRDSTSLNKHDVFSKIEKHGSI